MTKEDFTIHLLEFWLSFHHSVRFYEIIVHSDMWAKFKDNPPSQWHNYRDMHGLCRDVYAVVGPMGIKILKGAPFMQKNLNSPSEIYWHSLIEGTNSYIWKDLTHGV
jgi:hypothetical protein